MRARDFLIEAQNYDAMFDGLIKIADAGDSIETHYSTKLHTNLLAPKIRDHIKWAKLTLKKNDRIIWYLRYAKLDMINELTQSYTKAYENSDESGDEETKIKIKPILNMLQIESNKTSSKLSPGPSSSINWLRQIMEHWFSLPIAKIQNYTFRNENMQDISGKFGAYEEEWKEERAGTLDQDGIQEGDKKIIEFGDGVAWWHLPRASCSAEGNAMGHCGNINWRDADGSTILSLRTELPNGLVKPHLTFILDPSGYLGEMKGRSNETPAEKYHPYIIKLLQQDIIKGIKGGGYMPENNFSLNDLDQETREKLLDEKPQLGTIAMMAKKFGADHQLVTERVAKTLESLEGEGVRFFGYNETNKMYNLDHWKDINQFAETTDGNLKNYISYVTGEEIFDMWGMDTNHYIEEFFNDMPEKLKDELKEIIQKIEEKTPGTIDNDEEYESMYELLKHNDLEDILTQGNNAIMRGYESGAEGQVYNAFRKATENLENGLTLTSDKTGGEWLFDENISLSATSDVMIELLSDETFMEEVVDQGGWLINPINIDEPYHGWDEYDEESAYDSFSEMSIYEIKDAYELN